MQLSTLGEDFVLDPLSVSIAPALEIIQRKPLFLHGADFDIRIIRRAYAFEPAKIFDTMIAAQLLGYPKQGYADLAEKHCGVKLSKDAQRADWSKRPLDPELLTYAANDTHYLPVIAQAMTEELRALGRLAWHEESCQRLLSSVLSSEEKKEKKRPWQIKGSKELNNGRALAILKELWLWREEEARKRDRPSFKILNNDTLVQIAAWAVKNPGLDVAEMPGSPKPVRGQYAFILNELIRSGTAKPEERFIIEKSRERPPLWTDKDTETFNKIKALVEKTASELKIHVSLLATNAVMRQLAHRKPQNVEDMIHDDLLMNWQAAILGPSILTLLTNPN